MRKALLALVFAGGLFAAGLAPALAAGPSPLPTQPTSTPVSAAAVSGNCADTSVTVTLGSQLGGGTLTVTCPAP